MVYIIFKAEERKRNEKAIWFRSDFSANVHRLSDLIGVAKMYMKHNKKNTWRQK